jgi:transcriptional regulator with XRE-family HTH domain
MSKEAKKFGKKMRELRLEKGMSQLDLAQETGLDLTTINELENGHREPLLGTIKKIVKVLGNQVL